MHCMTIDLESWIHSDELLEYPPPKEREERKAMDNRHITQSTKDILHLLDLHNAKATFFVVAEIYDWYPSLVQEIKSRGHEIAFHTYNHPLPIRDDAELANQIDISRKFLKHFKPKGFRAPSLNAKRSFFPILKKHFKYDSSLYHYQTFEVGGIKEIPVSTMPFVKRKSYFPKHLNAKLIFGEFPFGSGYYMGLLGKSIGHLIRHEERKGRSCVLFFHPWQILTPPPEFMEKAFLLIHPKWIPYSFNIRKTIIHLLKNFRWNTIEGVHKI